MVEKRFMMHGQYTKSDICPVCEKNSIDKYKWCRPCIVRAAMRASRYFLERDSRFAQFDREDLQREINKRAVKLVPQFKKRLVK